MISPKRIVVHVSHMSCLVEVILQWRPRVSYKLFLSVFCGSQ